MAKRKDEKTTTKKGGFGKGKVALLVCVLLVGGLGFLVFGPPTGSGLKMPLKLVALDTPAGQQLLKTSEIHVDFVSLQKHFVAQKRRAYCGVASGVTVVNALRAGTKHKALNQASFFGGRAHKVVSWWRVSLMGMTLSQFGWLLKAHGLQVKVFHADAINDRTFREVVRKSLRKKGVLVVVNYHRKKLSQKGAGHISPLAAYHRGADRFLVMDVARHKYPPTWVPARELWEAMDTKDSDSGRKRGFVIASLAF